MWNVLKGKLIGIGRDEDGAAFVVTLAVFFFLYLLIAGVYAVGDSVQRKIQMQGACDAAAYSAAVVQADALSRIATINRAMSWTYAQLTRCQMDCIMYGWLQDVREHHLADELGARLWAKQNPDDKNLLRKPIDAAMALLNAEWTADHNDDLIDLSNPYVTIGADGHVHHWLIDLRREVKIMDDIDDPFLLNYAGASKILLNGVTPVTRDQIDILCDSLLDRVARCESFHSGSTGIWRMYEQIAWDKADITSMGNAIENIVSGIGENVDMAVRDVLMANLPPALYRDCEYHVRRSDNPRSDYFDVLRNTEDDEGLFLRFAGFDDPLTTFGPGTDEWFVRGLSRPQDGEEGIRRSYWTGRTKGQGGLYAEWDWFATRFVPFTYYVLGVKYTILMPEPKTFCEHGNVVHPAERNRCGCYASGQVTTRRVVTGQDARTVPGHWQQNTISFAQFNANNLAMSQAMGGAQILMTFRNIQAANGQYRVRFENEDIQQQTLAFQALAAAGNAQPLNIWYTALNALPPDRTRVIEETWVPEQTVWTDHVETVTDWENQSNFRLNMKATTYADTQLTKGTYPEAFVGVVARPLVLKKSYFGDKGTITVGLSARNVNPFAKILGTSGISRGIYSAFNHFTGCDWSFVFASAKAGYKLRGNASTPGGDAYEGGRPNRSYRIDWDSSGTDDWNLSQSDWDAVMVQVRCAEEMAQDGRWVLVVDPYRGYTVSLDDRPTSILSDCIAGEWRSLRGARRTSDDMIAGGGRTARDAGAYVQGWDEFGNGLSGTDDYDDTGHVTAKWHVEQPGGKINWVQLSNYLLH